MIEANQNPPTPADGSIPQSAPCRAGATQRPVNAQHNPHSSAVPCVPDLPPRIVGKHAWNNIPSPRDNVPDLPAPDTTADSIPHSALCTPHFERFPGETPRAFSAFVAFFDFGQDRSLPALADYRGEKLDTLKKWSSRFRWNARIQQFNSGLLQQHAETETAIRARQAADWARRASLNREQEWEASQKLSGAVRCFLDSFGDRELEKMTLGQVSRALQISSQLARQALSGDSFPETPALAPIQLELTAALKKAYSEPPSPTGTERGTLPATATQAN